MLQSCQSFRVRFEIKKDAVPASLVHHGEHSKNGDEEDNLDSYKNRDEKHAHCGPQLNESTPRLVQFG
jgi:hypothetical protein